MFRNMPPLPPVQHILRTQFVWSCVYNQNIHSSFYWHLLTEPSNSSDLQAFAALCASKWGSTLNSSQPTDVTLSKITASHLGNPVFLDGVYTGSGAGNLTGQHLVTLETSVLVNYHIGRRYRGGKPRVYLPLGGGNSLSDGGHWQDVFVSQVQSQFTSFVNGVTSGAAGTIATDGLYNVSYYSGKELRPTPVIDQVLSWSVNKIPGSQRRRMGR